SEVYSQRGAVRVVEISVLRPEAVPEFGEGVENDSGREGGPIDSLIDVALGAAAHQGGKVMRERVPGRARQSLKGAWFEQPCFQVPVIIHRQISLLIVVRFIKSREAFPVIIDPQMKDVFFKFQSQCGTVSVIEVIIFGPETVPEFGEGIEGNPPREG